jgi:integrase/recombinase XerD
MFENTTNMYAETDLEMKAKALAKSEVTEETGERPHWPEDPELMASLPSL